MNYNLGDEMLDECLPIDFRHHIIGQEVHTAQFAGFKGLKNGKLLSEAEAAGYELFLTVDQGIPAEQNLSARRISVLIIHARTNQIEDLTPLRDCAQCARNEWSRSKARIWSGLWSCWVFVPCVV
jgi:hypothetical protein